FGPGPSGPGFADVPVLLRALRVVPSARLARPARRVRNHRRALFGLEQSPGVRLPRLPSPVASERASAGPAPFALPVLVGQPDPEARGAGPARLAVHERLLGGVVDGDEPVGAERRTRVRRVLPVELRLTEEVGMPPEGRARAAVGADGALVDGAVAVLVAPVAGLDRIARRVVAAQRPAGALEHALHAEIGVETVARRPERRIGRAVGG